MFLDCGYTLEPGGGLCFVFVEDYLTLKHEFWAIFNTATPNKSVSTKSVK